MRSFDGSRGFLTRNFVPLNDEEYLCRNYYYDVALGY